MPEGYFNTERDNALITAGTHFWCHGHLTAVPIDEQSPDSRYCEGCYKFLCKEAEMLPSHTKKATWVPKKPIAKIGAKKSPHVPQDGGGILSTVEGKKFTVDKIKAPVSKVIREKRGRKQTGLPLDYIKQLAEAGMGYKKIAARVKVEYGVNCSYRTIARIVKGERKQLTLAL